MAQYFQVNPKIPFPQTDGYILQTVNGVAAWVPPSLAFVQVDTYADLPDPSLHATEIYYVKTSTGVWLVNRKSRGFYRSNGISWEYGGELIEAFASSNFRVYDNVDSSKEVKINAANITTGQTRTLIAADHDVYLSELRQGVLIADLPCNASVLVGSVVSVDALGLIINAQANNMTNSRVIGVCESKSTLTTATVRIKGLTQPYLTGLTPGTRYFLSDTTPGELQTTFPNTPGSVVYYIGTAVSAYVLYVEPALIVIRS